MTTGRAILLKSVADIAARATALVSFPIVARFAGPDGYGAYGQLITVVGFVIPFASLGLISAVVRFFVGGPWNRALVAKVKRTAMVLLATTVSVGVVMLATARWLGELLLDWPDSTQLFRIGAILVVLGTFELFLLELLRARGWLTQYVTFQISHTLLNLTAVVILLPSGYGIVELVLAHCAIKFVLIAATALFVHRKAHPDRSTGAPDIGLGAMIRFGLPLTISGLGLLLVNVGDRSVIGYFLSAEDLGRYASIYVVATLLVLVGAPFFLPLYPRLMHAIGNARRDLVEEDIKLFHRYLSLVLIPTAFYVAVITAPALLLLAGSEFRVRPILTYLIVAGLFVDQWNGPAHYLLICHDRTLFLQNTWLAFGGLNIAANIELVPRYGLEGAAVVTLVSFAGLDLTIFLAANRLAPIRHLYRWQVGAYAVVASIVGAVLAAQLLDAFHANFIRVVVATAGFWFIYLAIMIGCRQIGPEDGKIIRRALKPSEGPLPPEMHVDSHVT